MPDSLFLPIIDNGTKISFTDWGYSLFHAAVAGCFKDRALHLGRLSYCYPAGAMNLATELFLQSGMDRMVVIDTDQTFSPQDVTRLISHDVPLVAGMYCKKKPGMEFAIKSLDDENPFSDDPKEMELIPLIEVACVARGFINIHRSVFELMSDSVEIIFDEQSGGNIRNWWKPYSSGHSEDFAFCERYRALGGNVFCDQRIRVGHFGSIQFPIPGTYELSAVA